MVEVGCMVNRICAKRGFGSGVKKSGSNGGSGDDGRDEFTWVTMVGVECEGEWLGWGWSNKEGTWFQTDTCKYIIIIIIIIIIYYVNYYSTNITINVPGRHWALCGSEKESTLLAAAEYRSQCVCFPPRRSLECWLRRQNTPHRLCRWLFLRSFSKTFSAESRSFSVPTVMVNVSIRLPLQPYVSHRFNNHPSKSTRVSRVSPHSPYVLFNTIPPRPYQTEEGTAMKELGRGMEGKYIP